MMYRLLERALLASLVATSIGSLATAQDHLRLRGGKLLTGRVVAYDRTSKTVTFAGQDGTRQELAVKDLDRLSAYKLAKTKAKPGDPHNEILLGNFARDIELYAYAGKHYRRALELDPGLRSEVEAAQQRLRQEAAEYCMHQANEAIARDDTAEAEKWLTTLVEKLPDEPQTVQAAALLAQHYAANHEVKDDALERDHEDLLKKELKTGKRYYDNMLRNIQRGLVNARSSSAARSALENAWKDGEHALGELDDARKKLGDDPQAGRALDAYGVLMREHMVSSQLHLASMFTTRSSYSDALECVNRALALDPTNREALTARSRIELASSRGWGWGWGGGVPAR